MNHVVRWSQLDFDFTMFGMCCIWCFISEFVSKRGSSIPKCSCAEIVTMSRIEEDCASLVPPGDAERSRTGEQDPGPTVWGKAHEFFQICDLEGKGFVTHQDKQRLHPELCLSLKELQKVFVTLDADGNGSLTPKEFTTGFSQFLLGQIALNNEIMEQSESEKACPLKCKESEDEEFQFSNLMDHLGAKIVLDDESDMKQLWFQLRKDEPHLLSSFEEFLVRIYLQLQEADNERNELEYALKKKIAAYDEEIQHLYEEMEQQIQKEREQFLLKDTKRFQSCSQELECKLLSKEQELEQLVQNQKRLEQKCTELLSGKEETKVENTKLKLTNQELLRQLERTSHELCLAQQQLQVLHEEASRIQKEKEINVKQVFQKPAGSKDQGLSLGNTWKTRYCLTDMASLDFLMAKARYRSVTKQFFRKADVVILMYDITVKDTFTAVKQWLRSIEETTGENILVLLLGNKTDEKRREIPMGMGKHLAKVCVHDCFYRRAIAALNFIPQDSSFSCMHGKDKTKQPQLAQGCKILDKILGETFSPEELPRLPREVFESPSLKDYNLIFYECSVYSGYNTKASMLHLARILKKHEDKVKEKTIELQSDTNKTSCCIRPLKY